MDLIAYLRVSTQRQVDEGLGREVQQRGIRKFARDGHHRIVDWESDEARSGDADDIDRPGLSVALARLERGEAQGLVVYRLDRLARRLWRQEMVIHQLQRQGVVVLSSKEADTDSEDPERV